MALAPAMLGAALLAAAPSAQAPATVIYRCTAASGAVALQDEPCPTGQRQERREIAAFAPVAAPPAGFAADAADPVDASAPTDDGPAPVGAAVITMAEPEPAPRPLSMPPPIWRCTNLDGRSRFADAFDPQPRCVPLSMLGVDLSRAPPSAATLCRTVEDHCVELGGEAACAAWKERLDAAESALRRAFSDTAAERRSERDRAKAVVEGDCRR